MQLYAFSTRNVLFYFMNWRFFFHSEISFLKNDQKVFLTSRVNNFHHFTTPERSRAELVRHRKLLKKKSNDEPWNIPYQNYSKEKHLKNFNCWKFPGFGWFDVDPSPVTYFCGIYLNDNEDAEGFLAIEKCNSFRSNNYED